MHYDNRFARTAGFKNNIALVIKSLNPENIDTLMLNCAYAKIAFGQFKKAGFDLDKQLLVDKSILQCGHLGGTHG